MGKVRARSASREKGLSRIRRMVVCEGSDQRERIRESGKRESV
ncbi:hypothetical protein COLO4_38198 [Corchorus olitorius]|uniref:Uncharacterized protein n=1 Tax=Corchorus olitorius TaxID=93759 RepID=A0A1R3FWH3_9ROSI|nr:hypothetical protein COLO4_38198 [Corchorus olitorius]